MNVSTSEYVSVGHPDSTCDYIASYLLDRYLTNDPDSRVALEVQLKDTFCTVSGEVTSKWKASEGELAQCVRNAICDIGYTRDYQSRFGKENAICGDDVEVTFHLSQQSPDIALGVDNDGWGDQGIYWGMAVDNRDTDFLPTDYWLARSIANDLYERRRAGLDIKTLVTTVDEIPVECVVAIPIADDGAIAVTDDIFKFVRGRVGDKCRITINGTGRYVRHGSIGDCGTTGRKLAANFYGGNCRIGGGTMMGKDPTKADVALNIYARILAKQKVTEFRIPWVQCGLSSCIGRPDVRIAYFDRNNNLIDRQMMSVPPSKVIGDYGLKSPTYAERCKHGFFGYW